MVCRFCGNVLPDRALSCNACGKSRKSATSANVFYCVIGALFLLGGFLPFLIPDHFVAYQAYLSNVIYVRGGTAVAAYSCFSKFSNFLTPLFSFPSSFLAVYVGILLLRREAFPKLPFIAFVIVNSLWACCSAVTNLLIYTAPKLVLSLYITDDSVIGTGEKLVRTIPEFLYYYQQAAIFRTILALFLTLLGIGAILLSALCLHRFGKKKEKTPTTGGVLMLCTLPIASLMGSILTPYACGWWWGFHTLEAYTAAQTAFSQYILPCASIILLLILILSVLLKRVWRWVLVLPVTGHLMLLGLIPLLFAKFFLHGFAGLSSFSLAVVNFRYMAAVCTVALIGLYYWLSAVSKGRMPLWLQIVWPLCLPPVYICTEVVTKVFFGWIPTFSWGTVLTALLSILFSLTIRKRRSPDRI